jgi:hypothetical protein
VQVLAREFLCIGNGIRMRRAIGIAFHGNRGHSNDRGVSKPLLQFVILDFAFSQAETPTIIVDRDRDMIGILE